MRELSVREARAELAGLLDAVEAGEEIVITRRGVPVARLTQTTAHSAARSDFPSRKALREQLPQAKTPAHEVIRELRASAII